ncbi:RimJ/RimL family protein N-acetyltransferase [Stackebrandtia endophytica]|uniref:RimJ/RimL family protein N-acetyltransferase n=1 Tax=Stackebrandtia endophytica TaxID=1496996 RepID=A0A543AVZ4_9ACTN|nr:GNAT family protein [Stackebrandtia endophytica]TQL76756.1 RimJ/RimL family protein N-acetyltransferase [Stackebrandtia endophytica]
MSTPFTVKPTLRGELVTLRPIRRGDADVLGRILREDPDVARLTGYVHSSTEEPSGPPIEQLRDIYGSWAESDDRLVLGVVDNVDGALVGEVVLSDWNEDNRSCGFRTFISAAGRGRGLGTEATGMIIDYGLQEINMHRIRLEVYDFNPRARRVYEKVGFVHEGIGRDALRFDDRWIDVHYMAILATDQRPGGGPPTGH